MAIIGDLSIVASDGETLYASSDLTLAWRWAEHEVNLMPDLRPWAEVPYRDQVNYAADALMALREAYGPVTD